MTERKQGQNRILARSEPRLRTCEHQNGQPAERWLRGDAPVCGESRGCQRHQLFEVAFHLLGGHLDLALGEEGNVESARLVRNDRKFISERAFSVTYMEE